jgi:cytochrome c-type biogenesis protein CcmH
MALFWIAAAILAGGAALLVMVFARKAAAGAGAENPAMVVHRRQLAEIDDLSDRGVLNPEDKAAVRAEAGRRLLTAAALAQTAEGAGSKISRRIAVAFAVAAGGLALGLYFVFGAPGAVDQSYKSRVASWRKSDPATLDAPRMAAVLRDLSAERPNDPEVFGFLGRAELASGDAYAATKAFTRAVRLAPTRADYQAELGAALTATSEGKLSPDAVAAYRRALALDPNNLPARYALGRMRIVAGDRAGGVALWRGIVDALPAGDPRRAPFAAEIDRIAAGGALEAPRPEAPAAGADPSAFIRGMVAAQAAKLTANPNDPEGWARLVRSYGVLRDAPAQAKALAEARRQFADRPDALRPVEAEAKAHPAGN